MRLIRQKRHRGCDCYGAEYLDFVRVFLTWCSAKRKEEKETGTIAATPEGSPKRKRKRGQPAWLPEQARAERDMLLSDNDHSEHYSGESEDELK